jgi:hypothetical protein
MHFEIHQGVKREITKRTKRKGKPNAKKKKKKKKKND